MPGLRVPLREATPFGQSPNYLIRDRDGKFGPSFARMAATSGIKLLKTPYHAPRANAICERFVGNVRRACLDHLLILQEKQFRRVLRAYVDYLNRARPHQEIKQQIPERSGEPVPVDHPRGKILSLPVLGGLHLYWLLRISVQKKSVANDTSDPLSLHLSIGQMAIQLLTLLFISLF